MSGPGRLFVLRHGETEWSRTGRHTGTSDIPLTDEGERAAARWAPELSAHPFAAVLCSPLQRARRTAELAGLPVTGVDPDLREWEYGAAEGRTTAELREEHPGWDVWADGPPGGEPLAALGERADRVLTRVAAPLEQGDVALVAHGHVLRVLIARWLQQPPVLGGRLALPTAGVAVLGHEHDRQVLLRSGLTPGSL